MWARWSVIVYGKCLDMLVLLLALRVAAELVPAIVARVRLMRQVAVIARVLRDQDCCSR